MSGGSKHVTGEFLRMATQWFSALFSLLLQEMLSIMGNQVFTRKSPELGAQGPEGHSFSKVQLPLGSLKSYAALQRFPGALLVSKKGGAVKSPPGPSAPWQLLPALLSGGRKP